MSVVVDEDDDDNNSGASSDVDQKDCWGISSISLILGSGGGAESSVPAVVAARKSTGNPSRIMKSVFVRQLVLLVVVVSFGCGASSFCAMLSCSFWVSVFFADDVDRMLPIFDVIVLCQVGADVIFNIYRLKVTDNIEVLRLFALPILMLVM